MKTNTNEIVIERIFNAPRELVWRAWTEAKHFQQWFGPKVFTVPNCTIDFREGGKYLFAMMDPAGKKFWVTGTYETIRPMEFVEYTDCFADEQGNMVGSAHYGFGDAMPMIMRVSLTFEDLGAKTRMTLRHGEFQSAEMVEMTKASWIESFEKLQASLL
jgi:uncharacterized protein YndB with AHSA1/START domain